MSLGAILNSARTLVYYQRLQQILANNLANVSTDGYKADLFGLRTAPGTTRPEPVTALDLRQGSFRETGRRLDLALSGPGFFVVETPAGERLSRGGALRLNATGQLVDVHNNPVLGVDGPLFITGTELPAEGFVHISALVDDYYKYDRAGHVIKGFRSGNTYRLGDPVQVAVAAVDVDRRELDFRLLGKSGKAARKLAPSRGVSKKGPTKKVKSQKDARGKKKGSKRKRR
ncbi:MAG: flagellar hook-basal body complex protein [Planctomycetes bacterium]|nr:flagellar hook-basal body complex protein [Planctomycetota bacterium]